MKISTCTTVVALAALISGWPSGAEALPLDPEGWETLRLAQLDTPPAPSVASDLTLLADGEGSSIDDAVMGLINWGPSALPEVHSALQDPGYPDNRKPLLLFVIGIIGDASSASEVVSFGSGRAETHDKLLECLRLLRGPTPSADAFALARVADAEADPWVRQLAMLYLADHALPEAATWADVFRVDPSPDFQAAALYADAIAERPGTQAALVGLINAGTSHDLREPLYLSLSRLATPAEFDSELIIEVQSSPRFENGRKLAEMRTLSGQARTDFAIALLGTDDPQTRIQALRDIIARGDQAQLAPYAHSSVPFQIAALVRRELRQANFQVVEGETVSIEPVGP